MQKVSTIAKDQSKQIPATDRAQRTGLKINTPGDRYEQEADAMADRVMRMSPGAGRMLPGGGRMPMPAGGGRMLTGGGRGQPVTGLIASSVQRKCAECEEEEEKKGTLMRKGEGGGFDVSPAMVSKLGQTRGGGVPLPGDTRRFMEGAFSADFSRVRIHADEGAAEMNHDINAHAFTHGKDIYFNSGKYDLSTISGKFLLAHELTHVTQQEEGTALSSLQRSCLTASECAASACGSPGAFSANTARSEAPAQTARTAQIRADPRAAAASGHSRRATNFEALMRANGVDLSIVYGIFVHSDMSSEKDAQTQKCNTFPTWIPPYSGPPDKDCVFIHDQDEKDAETYATNPRQATIGGKPRADWLNYYITTTIHELQHIIYDAAPHGALGGISAACSRSTIIDGHPISYFLSELSAEMSEFPPTFESVRRKSRDYPTMMTNLKNAWRFDVENCGESLKGILKSLRCTCNCSEVETYLIDTIQFTSASWPQVTKDVFRELMTTKFPEVRWTLHRF